MQLFRNQFSLSLVLKTPAMARKTGLAVLFARLQLSGSLSCKSSAKVNSICGNAVAVDPDHCQYGYPGWLPKEVVETAYCQDSDEGAYCVCPKGFRPFVQDEFFLRCGFYPHGIVKRLNDSYSTKDRRNEKYLYT